jgi:hypothetical protein
MYQPDEHYYVIRRESRIVYFLTIFIFIYFGYYYMAFAFSVFGCNLLFDDEEEEDLEPEEPALTIFYEFFNSGEGDDLVGFDVNYDTLTAYLELLMELPHLINFSSSVRHVKKKINKYLLKKTFFFFLNNYYHFHGF